jgi:hypothetical protein
VCKFTLSTAWFSDDIFAVIACDDSLSMAEDIGGSVAATTFDFHKVRIGGWDQALELVSAFLIFIRGIS